MAAVAKACRAALLALSIFRAQGARVLSDELSDRLHDEALQEIGLHGAGASTSLVGSDFERLSEWQSNNLTNPWSDGECDSAVPGSVARRCTWGCSKDVYCKCPVGLQLRGYCPLNSIGRKFGSNAAGCSCEPPEPATTPDPRYQGPYPDDMSKAPNFDMDRLWVCDIKGSNGNGVFLFMATISESGDVSDMASKEGDTVVLADDMYDINTFTPDFEPDGSLDFKIEFGQRNTRGMCCLYGWFVDFKGLKHMGNGRWSGKVTENTSGHVAPRDVELISYGTLSPEQKRRYPDFVVPRHWATVPAE